MRRFLFFLLAFVMVVTAGCTNDDTEAKGDKASYLYAHYQFTADEGKELVTGLFQFFERGPKNEPLRLQPPAGIHLDGVALTADSALQTGVYYEIQQPLANFTGNHTLTLTDEWGQAYKEEFEFEPLVLQTTIPATVKREALELAVSGLQPGENLRLLLVDMDFDTDDINRVERPTNGKLQITAEELQQVASGPVTLMLYKEVERKLKNGTAAGGKLSITYGLSREFELVD